MRVALFAACFNDTLFPATCRAALEVLERVGCEVYFPEDQTCCGQIHLNSGYATEGRRLAQRQLEALAGAQVVVTPSASCALTLREQFHELDAGAPAVYEFCSFLVRELGVEDVGARYSHSVTLHPTCHSIRMLGIGDAPTRLLRKVRDLELIELSDDAVCCGFGGTFAVKNPDVSAAMLTDKARAILDTGAEVCTAVDNSCLMQIGGGLSRARAGVRAVHIAEILATTG